MEFEMKKVSQLTNEQLTVELALLRQDERHTQARFLVHLSEMEERKLFAIEGYSAFTYLTRKLGYSEGSAYKRIVAARAIRRFPKLYTLLWDGKVTLTTVSMIHCHLTEENQHQVLSQVEGKSRLAVEKLMASLNLTQNNFSGEVASCHYVKEDRVRFKFTADAKLLEMVQRARELLGHQYPHANFEDIFTKAMEFFLSKHDPLFNEQKKCIEPKKCTVPKQCDPYESAAGKQQAQNHETMEHSKARVEMPKSHETEPGKQNQSNNSSGVSNRSRYIPQRLKNEVWKKDQGRCSYVSTAGHRCEERGFLQIDHIEPWAFGGSSTLDNLRLLCFRHNQLMAERYFSK
ncbi:MAG: HNH endonuclease [Deltaproteobacteria bacterium]|nr:HNH endonuclease [Deltaproteobacteria bacterium]